MVELKGINLGLCMCGSFCTYKKSFEAIERLKKINPSPESGSLKNSQMNLAKVYKIA